MLWTPNGRLTESADNFGTTFTEAALGTSIAAAGSANTKNSSITTILAAQTFDIYWVSIMIVGAFTSGSARRFLVDIFTDPAGGTTWGASPLINNLASLAATYTMGGYGWYQFPLFIKKGTSIGARCQSETASATARVLIRVQGAPDRPELFPAGQFVRTFGATTATTVGTAVTPGASGAMGSYSASLATTAEDLWYWQMALLSSDSSLTAVRYFMEAAVGDASNKIPVVSGAVWSNIGTVEAAGFRVQNAACPYGSIASGANVYIRGACDGTSDSTMSGIVYAVGG
jgi:hypothetical protein